MGFRGGRGGGVIGVWGYVRLNLAVLFENVK